jgi:hypothetical protein
MYDLHFRVGFSVIYTAGVWVMVLGCMIGGFIGIYVGRMKICVHFCILMIGLFFFCPDCPDAKGIIDAEMDQVESYKQTVFCK